MLWLEFGLTVDPEAAEAVAEVLHRFGRGGVSLEEAPSGTLSTPQVTVKTYLPLTRTAPRRQQRLERALWHLSQLYPLGALRVRTVAEEEWAEAWKEHFPILHIGQRLVVKPSWCAYEPQGQGVVLELDPGMAFGTGLHPTTQMCLQALEQYLSPGDAVLDLGTGSGILALAAAKLGARRVLALDTDPVAVKVARRNVQANSVSKVVRVRRGSLSVRIPAEGGPRPAGAAPCAPFDLALVNISARAVAELAAPLAASLTAGARVIASGFLEESLERVRRALQGAGFVERQLLADGEWRTLIASRWSSLLSP